MGVELLQHLEMTAHTTRPSAAGRGHAEHHTAQVRQLFAPVVSGISVKPRQLAVGWL